MPKSGVIGVMVMLGLAACSPGEHKEAQAHKPPAGKLADTGHTPPPVRHIADENLFHGWMCAWDCSVHQAGYAWGSRHKIVNPKDCRGPSQSFIEGCWSFTGEEGPFGHKEIFQDED